MALDAALLNTQHYKVRIKGKVERPLLHLGVVAIEKGLFGSPSTKGLLTLHTGIDPKVNTIALEELELTHFEAALQHASHYTTSTPLECLYIYIYIYI